MNKKKKQQLVILGIFFFIVLTSFAVLKIYQKNGLDEEVSKGESYSVIEIDRSQITEIGIIGSEGAVNLVKTAEGWKRLEDDSIMIDEGAVENYLLNVSSIFSDTKIEDVADFAQYGLDSPALTVTLQWNENRDSMKVGDYNSMISCYYFSMNDENTVYTVDSSVYYALNKSLDDFEKIEFQEDAG